MTWYDAKDYCEGLDAYLAEVPNAETQNILQTHAATLSPVNWWLGATDEKTVSICIHRYFLNLNYLDRNVRSYQKFQISSSPCKNQ